MEKKIPTTLSLFEQAKLRKELKKKSKNTSTPNSRKTTNKRNSSSRRRSTAAKKIQRTYKKRKNKKIYDQKYNDLPDDIKKKIEIEVKKYKKKENKIKELLDSNLNTLKKYKIFFKYEIVDIFNDQEPNLQELEIIINNIETFKNKIKNIDDPKFKEDLNMLKIEIKKILKNSVNKLEIILENSIARDNEYSYTLIENFYNTLTKEDEFNTI